MTKYVFQPSLRPQRCSVVLAGSLKRGMARRALTAVIVIAATFWANEVPAQVSAVTSFETPQDAVAELVDAARGRERERILALFGPDSEEWVTSGDPVQDRQALERFLEAYDQKNRLDVENDTRAVLVIGDDDFPFPFPVTKAQEGWAFNAEEGKEELLNRRIGRNELNTIEVMRALVDAQIEYASADRDGDGILEYAPKFASSPGKMDGLYWPTEEGEPASPVGSLVAEARAEGYGQQQSNDDGARAYHGYYYKPLLRQGASGSGGEQEFVIGGNMIGGFGVLSYPVRYGNSGVMSFVVSHTGQVYEADLGPDTAKLASEMNSFDPTPEWVLVKEGP